MGAPHRRGLHPDYSIAAAPEAVKLAPSDDAAASWAPHRCRAFVLPRQAAARFSRISKAGSFLPSRISRNAPPPVEM